MGKTAATFEKEAHDESGLQNPSGLAYVDQNMAQRVMLEEEFEEKALAAITEAKTQSPQGGLGEQGILACFRNSAGVCGESFNEKKSCEQFSNIF